MCVAHLASAVSEEVDDEPARDEDNADSHDQPTQRLGPSRVDVVHIAQGLESAALEHHHPLET